MAEQIKAWGPAVVWMAATFALSHRSAVSIPFDAPDYVAHAGAYAVLGALYVWALAGGRTLAIAPRLVLPAVLLAALYGLTDEFHQSFVPGRDASMTDVLADVVGGAFGAAAACYAALRFARR